MLLVSVVEISLGLSIFCTSARSMCQRISDESGNISLLAGLFLHQGPRYPRVWCKQLESSEPGLVTEGLGSVGGDQIQRCEGEGMRPWPGGRGGGGGGGKWPGAILHCTHQTKLECYQMMMAGNLESIIGRLSVFEHLSVQGSRP